MDETLSAGEVLTPAQQEFKDYVVAHVPGDSEEDIEGHAEGGYSIPQDALDIPATSVTFYAAPATDSHDNSRYQISFSAGHPTRGKQDLMVLLIDPKQETGFQGYFGTGKTIAAGEAFIERIIKRLSELEEDGLLKPAEL